MSHFFAELSYNLFPLQVFFPFLQQTHFVFLLSGMLYILKAFFLFFQLTQFFAELPSNPFALQA